LFVVVMEHIRCNVAGCVVAVLLLQWAAHGHAHVFIDYTLHARFTDSSLAGVEVVWTFDRMFAAFIRKEFDRDKDGAFSADEQELIRSGAFGNLAKNSYFAVLSLDGKKLPVPAPQEFTATLDEKAGVVSYGFFLPLNVKAEHTKHELTAYFYDPVIYVAFTVFQKGVGVSAASEHINADVKLRRVKYTNRPTVCFQKEAG
jgi:ABC-type uncharacterized transport system substrate-binding protein